LSELLLTSALGSLWAALGVEEKVPPSERARVVANELFVMSIVVLSACPERKEMVQRPWEFVARVRVDGLEQAQNDPDIHGQNVKILGNAAEDDRSTDSAETQKHDLDGRGVFSSETEWCRVLMVNLVNSLVQRSPVQRAVRPVVPGILKDKKDGDLVGHFPNRREGNGRF